MKLVVGLGNPGRKYVGTRHNVGFEAVDELARRLAGSGGRKARFHAEVLEAQDEGESLLLVWPQTYMNLSGRTVGEAVEFYKLDLHRLLIVCDDFHLPVGTIRFRARGSPAGQKGLANILQQLGTDEVSRLRIGVGPLPAGWDAVGYVLGRFSEGERESAGVAIQRAADGIKCWIRDGVDVAMNRFNQVSK
jgi:PTH1 family peptidyl-tRNA hydrolase